VTSVISGPTYFDFPTFIFYHFHNKIVSAQRNIHGIQGADPGGRSPPLKPTKVTLFTNIFTIREKTPFAIYGHFVVHSFFTAVLWSILHPSYSGEPVMRRLPNITKIAPLTSLAGSDPVAYKFYALYLQTSAF